MCDRSKEEVLARELAIEWFTGNKSTDQDILTARQFVDLRWETFKGRAKVILEILENHEYES